ncbi:OsmC family protein [Nocardioides sp.]|uniref:OsmC family protein n=1 Tax=Nocardioides sp. TaxID=35761 RepID=UPI00272022EB|nr:OsmC family protein [Nocardioides sp.]MDO9455588.1 OsmC family protein [Nocardioides sp.]
MATTPKSTVPFAVSATGTGVAQSLEAGGHRFESDALPSFGGADAAPSPLYYVLGALTSCNQVTGSLVAKDLGIALGTWSFEVVGDLDPSVIGGGADGNANFDKVTARVTVETDADDAQFAQLVSETERRCPVTQLFKRSGLELDSAWTKAELTVPVA